MTKEDDSGRQEGLSEGCVLHAEKKNWIESIERRRAVREIQRLHKSSGTCGWTFCTCMKRQKGEKDKSSTRETSLRRRSRVDEE